MYADGLSRKSEPGVCIWSDVEKFLFGAVDPWYENPMIYLLENDSKVWLQP